MQSSGRKSCLSVLAPYTHTHTPLSLSLSLSCAAEFKLHDIFILLPQRSTNRAYTNCDHTCSQHLPSGQYFHDQASLQDLKHQTTQPQVSPPSRPRQSLASVLRLGKESRKALSLS